MGGEDNLVAGQQRGRLDPALGQVGPLLNLHLLGNRVGALEVGAEEDVALIGHHRGRDRKAQLPVPLLAAGIEVETDDLVQLGVIKLGVTENRFRIVIGGRRVHHGALDILVPDGMAGISAEANKVSLRNAVRIGNAEEILLEEIGSLDTDALFTGDDLAEIPDLLEPLALENALRNPGANGGS